MAKSYNKRVRLKKFDEGDLVWKTVLPIGSKDPEYGKWSPNLVEPFIASKVYDGRAYRLMNLVGKEFTKGYRFFHLSEGHIFPSFSRV